MANTNNKVKSTDSVAKGTDQAEQKAQADLAKSDPAAADDNITRNTRRYIDGDGSGAKGVGGVDKDQQTLLDNAHLLDAEDAKAAGDPKESKPGDQIEEPASAVDQVNAIGERVQRAKEAQKKAQ